MTVNDNRHDADVFFSASTTRTKSNDPVAAEGKRRREEKKTKERVFAADDVDSRDLHAFQRKKTFLMMLDFIRSKRVHNAENTGS